MFLVHVKVGNEWVLPILYEACGDRRERCGTNDVKRSMRYGGQWGMVGWHEAWETIRPHVASTLRRFLGDGDRGMERDITKENFPDCLMSSKAGSSRSFSVQWERLMDREESYQLVLVDGGQAGEDERQGPARLGVERQKKNVLPIRMICICHDSHKKEISFQDSISR